MANNEELILNVETTNPYVIGAVAKVEQLPNGALITIVDKNGTTTATVLNGVDGTGIASATLNDDYTLTLLFTDGTSTTTASIRGATGESGVYCGATEPTNPDVDVWIDTSGDPYDIEGEIADDVDRWLEEHPEATTTVQDGAITVPKFASGVVDATLTQTGHPADAKATGDAITADRSRLTAVEGAASSLDARVTNLATLTEGSTTGDAELIDARVVGSTTYASLHQAIDTEFTNVKAELHLKPTRNLLNISNPALLDKVSLSVNGESAKVIATTGDTYCSAIYVIDTSELSKITASYKTYSGTGSGDIRIGHNASGVATDTITWDSYVTTNPKTYDVSNYDYIFVALYAVKATSSGIGNYITYVEVQIESGEKKTAYIPHLMLTDQIAREEIAELDTTIHSELSEISEYTKNKASYSADDWNGVNSSVDTAIGEVTVKALTAGTYRYAVQLIDVSDMDSVVVSWSGSRGDGVGRVRVGNGDASTISWVGWADASGTVVDTSAINALAVGLYVSVGTSLPKDTYNTFFKLQVEKGSVATPFLEPFTAVDYVARNAAGAEPFPDYYNSNGYLDGKIADAKALMQSCAGNGDAFIFITDEHYDGWNQKHSPSLIKYISDNLHINKLFDGGDNFNGANDEFANAIKKSFSGDIYHATGNHECFYLTDGNKLAYQFDMYSDKQIGNSTERYFYVDDRQRKMRYIVLSAYTATDVSESDANYNFTQEQIDWVSNIALNVESGWTIIIITHTLFAINLATDVCSVPSALAPMVTAIDSYDGNGTIACIVQGHTHRDRITSTPNGIPVIITTCDKNKVWTNSQDVDDLNVSRPSGTIAEQAFDIMVLDKENRKITALRVGAPALNGIGNNAGTEVQYREVTY